MEAQPLEAGPGVLVVPVVGWDYSAPPEAPTCRLVGVLILRGSGPEWVPVDGSRDEYPSGAASPAPPLPTPALLALAATVAFDAASLVLRPVVPASWAPLSVTARGELRRG